MTDQESSVTTNELLDSLSAMTDLDSVLGNLLPTGEITLDGPAQILVTELLQMARRTFGPFG